MDVQNLFRRSYAIWWRVRSLWVAGIIAALFGYGEYGASANFQQRTQTFPTGPGSASPFGNLAENPQIAWLIANLGLIIGGLLLVGLVWGLIAGLLGALANGAMIQIAAAAERGQPAGLDDGLRAGQARAWPLFLINLLMVLPGLVLVLVGFAVFGTLFWRVISGGIDGSLDQPAQILPALLGGLACFLPLVLLGALLSVILRLIGRFAARACVIEGLGPIASLRRSLALIRSNIGSTLLLWVMLGILSLLVSALLAIPTVALAFSLSADFFRAGFAGLSALSVVGLLAYSLVVNVGLGGVLTSFNATVWTLLYRSFVQREAAPVAPPV
jgi:hypothetical protein